MNDASPPAPSRRIIGSGLGFTEGPVISQSGAIYAVDLSRGLVYRAADGTVEVHADLGGGPNGATEGDEGSLFIAQSGRARAPGLVGEQPTGMTGGIQRIGADGTVAWVTMDLISPNDLCFGPDGLLYVTDPTRPMGRRHDSRLFRVDVASGVAELLISVDWYANGIAFGLEDDALYVANSDACQIVRFPLGADGLCAFDAAVQMTSGTPDGFAFDAEGNLLVPAVFPAEEQPSEIQVWSTSGELLDVFALGAGSHCTNVALGEERSLVVTASDAGQLLAFDNWPTAGLRLHPFRHS